MIKICTPKAIERRKLSNFDLILSEQHKVGEAVNLLESPAKADFSCPKWSFARKDI